MFKWYKSIIINVYNLFIFYKKNSLLYNIS